MKGFIAALVAIVSVGAGVLIAYVNYNNDAEALETAIEVQYKGNQSELANYGLKVVEAAKVSDKMKDALTEVATAAIQGRYGTEGSKAVFQWIQEQNPTVSPELYVQLQRIIEAGRTKFDNSQKLLLDKCGTYQNMRKQIPSKWFLSFAGFPKLGSLEKICTPITSEHARDAFNTGVDKGVKF